MINPTLKELQDKMGKILEARAKAKKKYNPSPTIKKEIKTDIRKEPTAEDILLMEEYSRGVYQGD